MAESCVQCGLTLNCPVCDDEPGYKDSYLRTNMPPKEATAYRISCWEWICPYCLKHNQIFTTPGYQHDCKHCHEPVEVTIPGKPGSKANEKAKKNQLNIKWEQNK